jgi:hypothetical protein
MHSPAQQHTLAPVMASFQRAEPAGGEPPAPTQNTFAPTIASFQDLYGLDDTSLSAWLGISLACLAALEQYPCPAPDSMSLPDECAAIARATGADVKVLQRIVLRAARMSRQVVTLRVVSAA